MSTSTRLFGFFLLASTLALGACTTTRIAEKHPGFAANNDQNTALVYFIRPNEQRTRGIADTDLEVEFGQVKALDLASGEYAAVRVKPTETDVTLRSMTYLTAQPMPVSVWRARHYSFEAGKTYYIHTRFEEQEWRGSYFYPDSVSDEKARELANRLKPAGDLAQAMPIPTL